MTAQVPLPDDVDNDDLRIVRLLVMACARVLHRELRRWPTPCELLDYMARALTLNLDEPCPYSEAVRWLAVAQQNADDYGVIVVDPGYPRAFRALVPGYVAEQAEAYLAAQEDQ